MKTNLESITNLEKKLSIEVPTQLVNQEFDKAFKYIQREVNLKGFRKGKAPLHQIRTMYSEKVKEDVLNNIVQSSFVSAIKEHKLNPISQPKLDTGDLQENAPFSFTINFEVRPEVKIVKKTGLKAQKEKINVSDKEIEDSVDKIRKNQSTFASVTEERPLKNGDTAMIDFLGFIDGAPLENGAATGHMLEIGSNQFIPGFEEGIVGMNKGENREVTISFPADYHVEALRAKPVTFKVDLQDIKTKVLPELNDEFFGKVNAKSLEDFKETIRKDIEMKKKNSSESNLREAIIRAFVEANPVEVPKSLYEANREAIIEDYRNRLKSQGVSDSDFADFQKQSGMDFDSAAKFTVQAGFLTDQLAQEENIRASDKDVDDRLGEMASKWGMGKDQIKKFYSERKGLDQLKNQITEEKVYDYLIKNAQIEEVDQIKESAKKD